MAEPRGLRGTLGRADRRRPLLAGVLAGAVAASATGEGTRIITKDIGTAGEQVDKPTTEATQNVELERQKHFFGVLNESWNDGRYEMVIGMLQIADDEIAEYAKKHLRHRAIDLIKQIMKSETPDNQQIRIVEMLGQVFNLSKDDFRTPEGNQLDIEPLKKILAADLASFADYEMRINTPDSSYVEGRIRDLQESGLWDDARLKEYPQISALLAISEKFPDKPELRAVAYPVTTTIQWSLDEAGRTGDWNRADVLVGAVLKEKAYIPDASLDVAKQIIEAGVKAKLKEVIRTRNTKTLTYVYFLNMLSKSGIDFSATLSDSDRAWLKGVILEDLKETRYGSDTKRYDVERWLESGLIPAAEMKKWQELKDALRKALQDDLDYPTVFERNVKDFIDLGIFTKEEVNAWPEVSKKGLKI